MYVMRCGVQRVTEVCAASHFSHTHGGAVSRATRQQRGKCAAPEDRRCAGGTQNTTFLLSSSLHAQTRTAERETLLREHTGRGCGCGEPRRHPPPPSRRRAPAYARASSRSAISALPSMFWPVEMPPAACMPIQGSTSTHTIRRCSVAASASRSAAPRSELYCARSAAPSSAPRSSRPAWRGRGSEERGGLRAHGAGRAGVGEPGGRRRGRGAPARQPRSASRPPDSGTPRLYVGRRGPQASGRASAQGRRPVPGQAAGPSFRPRLGRSVHDGLRALAWPCRPRVPHGCAPPTLKGAPA